MAFPRGTKNRQNFPKKLAHARPLIGKDTEEHRPNNRSLTTMIKVPLQNNCLSVQKIILPKIQDFPKNYGLVIPFCRHCCFLENKYPKSGNGYFSKTLEAHISRISSILYLIIIKKAELLT